MKTDMMKTVSVDDSRHGKAEAAKTRRRIERMFGAWESLQTDTEKVYYAFYLLWWVIRNSRAIQKAGEKLHQRRGAINATIGKKSPLRKDVYGSDWANTLASSDAIPEDVFLLQDAFRQYAEDCHRMREIAEAFQTYAKAFDDIRREVTGQKPNNPQEREILSILIASEPDSKWDGRKAGFHSIDYIHGSVLNMLGNAKDYAGDSVWNAFPGVLKSLPKHCRGKKQKTGGRVSRTYGETIVGRMVAPYRSMVEPGRRDRIDNLRGERWNAFLKFIARCWGAENTDWQKDSKARLFSLRSQLLQRLNTLDEYGAYWNLTVTPELREFAKNTPETIGGGLAREKAYWRRLSAIHHLAGQDIIGTPGSTLQLRVSRGSAVINPGTVPGTPYSADDARTLSHVPTGKELSVRLTPDMFPQNWPLGEQAEYLATIVAVPTITLETQNGFGTWNPRWAEDTEFGFHVTGYAAFDSVLRTVVTYHKTGNLASLIETVERYGEEIPVIRGNVTFEIAAEIVRVLSQRLADSIRRGRVELETRETRRQKIASRLRAIRSLETVSVQDSVRSGNCLPGTQHFMEKTLKLSASIESVSGRTLARLWKNAGYPEHSLFNRCIETAVQRQGAAN